MSIITSLKVLSIKLAFSTAVRLDFYRTMSVLLKNQMQLKMILTEFYAIHSKDGTKPKAALAVLMNEIGNKIGNGHKLSEALEGWAPYQEVAMITAGEGANRLSDSLVDVIHIIKSKRKITSAVRKAITYPVILMLASLGILRMVSTEVVPKLEMVSNKLLWPTSSWVLYYISNFIRDHGIALIMFIIGAIVFIIYIIPNWTKFMPSWRIALDAYPPFSLYRMLHGSTFLINLAVMLRANVMLISSLDILKNGASPWLRDRIEGIEFGAHRGRSIGVAMEQSGYKFPDEKAVRFLRALSDANGLDDAIYGFANDWLEDSIEQVQKAAGIMLGVGVISVGAVIILILLGSNGMTDSISQG